MGKWELGIWEFHLLRIRISMPPERCNVRNSYRLRLKVFTLLRLAILHLRVTRLSVRTFHAHEAQHTLMRIPARFLTKAKSAPSAEFLRLLERLSPLTAENFSALSALSLFCFPAIRSGWSRFIFVSYFFLHLINNTCCDHDAKVEKKNGGGNNRPSP